MYVYNINTSLHNLNTGFNGVPSLRLQVLEKLGQAFLDRLQDEVHSWAVYPSAVPYRRLQKVGKWIYFWDERMVIFQLSGFYCSLVSLMWSWDGGRHPKTRLRRPTDAIPPDYWATSYSYLLRTPQVTQRMLPSYL